MLTRTGFSYIELVISIILIATVVLFSVRIFRPALEQTAVSKELTIIRLLLEGKKENIKSQGFWIWPADTDITYNAAHPSEAWKSHLQTVNFNRRGIITTTFLKDQGGELVPFSGGDFDGNEARNKAQIAISLTTSEGALHTETFVLFSVATIPKLWAVTYIINTALKMYAQDNGGNYPATDQLSDLVSGYIPEIPNDPFTIEQQKVNHVEEATDWYYLNTGSSYTLAPNSHRNEVSINVTYSP